MFNAEEWLTRIPPRSLRYETLERTLEELEEAKRRRVIIGCYSLTNLNFWCDGNCTKCLFGGKRNEKIRRVKELIKLKKERNMQ